MKKKLAILGASYLQKPLVEKAIEMGIETHVFAWEEGNVVKDIADYYYPISIVEKEQILVECKKIRIDGITSIASDITIPTVNYIANILCLIGNSMKATVISTDKFEMRKALQAGHVSCPAFELFTKPKIEKKRAFNLPVIVKPTDRSGSRGVTKVESFDLLEEALEKALDSSINRRAIVEEFIQGREFSVEMISYKGKHCFVAITDKVTTGPPHFVEIEHHQPAQISQEIENRIINTVKKGLGCLDIRNGASHSEVLLMNNGEIRIVEIAGRMGGDLIGSHLVPYSTGFDFVKAVIDVSLASFNLKNFELTHKKYSGTYYILPKPGRITSIKDNSVKFNHIQHTISIMKEGDVVSRVIDGANTRAGIIVYAHPEKKVDLDPNAVVEFRTVNI